MPENQVNKNVRMVSVTSRQAIMLRGLLDMLGPQIPYKGTDAEVEQLIQDKRNLMMQIQPLLQPQTPTPPQNEETTLKRKKHSRKAE